MSDLTAFNSSKTELEKGVTLLEASAGTGKTYALARIFLRLVAEKGVEVSKILTVTFTYAATEELCDRIRSLLVEAYETLSEEPKEDEDPVFLRLREMKDKGVSLKECIRRIKLAITCFDEAIISTIHGFCNRVLAENSFETQSLFDVELDKASKEMALEGVYEYWRERFVSVHPVLAAAASTQKVKPGDMADFFNGLPKTQEYELGFENETDFEAGGKVLISEFDKLKESWLEDRESYGSFVENCIQKRLSAHIHRKRYAELLDSVFMKNGGVSPASLEVLAFMRASKLKNAPDFKEEEKPEFANQAEVFWSALETFGRAVRVDCVNYLKAKMRSWKARRGVLFFDDLLSLTAKAVEGQGPDGESLRAGLRESFDAALIDEFQDTDPVQFKIFSKLFGEEKSHWLFLIGDPKQSIYRFRGADLEAYFDFAEKSNAMKYSLDTNFRATTPLVKSVNAFFAESEEPFLHPELPFFPVNPNPGGKADKSKTFTEGGEKGSAFVIREMEWNKEKKPDKTLARASIQADMANEIHRLLNEARVGENRVRPKDIAILVRSNPQALNIWQYFRKRGLAATVFSEISLFEAPEAKELLWVMEGLVNVRSDRAIKRALATGLLGMTSKDFQSWQDKPEKWDAWVGLFREYYEIWRKKGIYVALRELFRKTRAIPLNLKRPDGERRVTNFLHLAEVLHQANSSKSLSPSSLIVWLRTQMNQKGLSNEEYQLRLESQSESIRILTVHKSKGLEYPIVFLPGHSFLPSQKGDYISYHREDGQLVVDLKKTADDKAKSLAQKEESQEDARVHYVALTRSSSRCYVYHAPIAFAKNSKIPAQVRMMRSWGLATGAEMDKGSELGDSFDKGVSHWVDAASLEAERKFFPANQPEVNGDGDFSENSLGDDSLEAEKWDSARKLPRGKIVDSFSGLSRQVGFDGRDLDGITSEKDFQEDFLGEEKAPIFKFPAGANAGNFMHDLFEHIDFSDSSNWESFVCEKLKYHQYSSRKWTSTIVEMVEQVMTAELEPGLSLTGLDKGDRLEEMEFHFPLAQGTLSELASLLPTGSILHKYLTGLNDDECIRIEEGGYLNGLVDLFFRSNGKYFVLDWKSNKLGGSDEGFGPKEIEREMLTHHYILQYHLYVVAAHRFLKCRMIDYSYDRNFGGAYYLFVRGMKVGSQKGIYFDLPDLRTIEVLESYLVTGK